MKLVEAIGIRLDNLLKEKNLKQNHLSKMGGIPRSTICVTRSAKRKTVTVDTLYQICATMEITLKEFFDDAIFEDVTD
ncbi:MAG: helix-turn-helix transcriptional regulator [Clostridia bacterium]|nr:helix-turn-helix transcriptional regulator [Clostridia bacterium]